MPDLALPSIAEILQSTHVLSAPDASATVVRVGERFAVKYGHHVTKLEAQSLSFVGEHSHIPVPKVYGTLTEESTGRNFIIMDVVSGESLATAWQNLTSAEKDDITDQIRQAMLNLRDIPSLGYIGAVDRQPCADGIFMVPGQHDPLVCGPFDSEDDMNQGILRKIASSEKPSYVEFVRRLISSTLHDHRISFTHGDLQPKNIMVQRSKSSEGETASLKIKIIDWEMAGWYPEYWESCNATLMGRYMSDWLDVVKHAMPEYPHEYLMMELIRHLTFY